MAQLIKSYPADPHKNRIVWSGDLETMKAHLNEIEARTKREQLSKCGTVFTEFARIDDLTLNTCIYKHIDTDDEETIDVNYSVFP
jgi:hypothetical protein